MTSARLLWLALLLPALLFAACAQADQRTPTRAALDGTGVDAQTGDEDAGATATPFTLPTLLPTQTRSAAPTAHIVASTATPTPSVEGTVDFEQPVVALRYQIDALQLDRRLEGNVSGQITVVDETKGVAAIRPNQGGVLLELQEVLPVLDLQPLPPGCDTCVVLSYSMPLADADGEGWLQDPVLLASIENYTAALLGPHLPPGTVLGLRRSATAYDVAHSLALDAEGMLYRWLATAGEIEEPVPVATVAPELPALLAALDADELAQQYVVECTSAPFETLYLHPAAAQDGAPEAGDEGQTIRLVCPSFSLPLSLLPLYLRLDALLDETLEGSGIPRPPTEVALAAVLDYRRDDGAHLELLLDGTARVTDDAGETVTTTLESSQVLSVTTSLLESDVLQPGLQAFADGEMDNVLLVRGEQGMLEAAWAPDDAPEAIIDEIELLDELIG